MTTTTRPAGVIPKLSIMMFLQFFVWGAWFATLGSVLTNAGQSDIIADAFGAGPIAAIVAPLFLGLIADRFFPSQIVMGVLFLLGSVLILAIPSAIEANNSDMVKYLILGHLLCYMPTLGLGNTISFANLKRDEFPKVRVWGTIGWIAAGLAGGFLAWSSSTNLFYMAGVAAALLGVFCFFLPDTPPPAKGEKINLSSLLMADAFKMLTKPAFFIFMLCSTLICIPLAYYYAFTSPFLYSSGFTQPASAMTIGQMSEIFFMLLIPFFFRKLGVKWMILIGMLMWVARYALFAFGAPDQVAWMLFAGIALHGICYDFFFVTGFMYTDAKAPKAIAGQAQSMLVFFTQGIGMFIGYWFAGKEFAPVAAPNDAATLAITEATPELNLTFGQKLSQMFNVGIPDSVDPAVISTSADQWKEFWMLPAMMAGAITVLFFFAFWDRTKGNASAEDVAEAASPDAESSI